MILLGFNGHLAGIAVDNGWWADDFLGIYYPVGFSYSIMGKSIS